MPVDTPVTHQTQSQQSPLGSVAASPGRALRIGLGIEGAEERRQLPKLDPTEKQPAVPLPYWDATCRNGAGACRL